VRLFIAVDLQEEARQRAAGIADTLGRILRARDPTSRSAITWVRPDRLHLTLRFLGDVDDARAADLAARFGESLATPAFDIEVSGIGIFPEVGPPRVIWLGVSAGAGALHVLCGEVNARLEAWGFGRDDRPFLAHLTLGRVRRTLDWTARRAVADAPGGDPAISRVDRVVLYQSRLATSGPIYSALACAGLADAGAIAIEGART
jgi:2'-5' RNA ligase